MPYKMKKDGEEFCVYNSETGEKKGCSGTREQAIKHMRALYANENKDMRVEDIDMLVKEAYRTFCLETETEYEDTFVEKALEIEAEGEMEEKYYEDSVVPYYTWATSYAELEANREAQEASMKANELVSEFPALCRSIFDHPEIKDKKGAILNLANELADRLPDAVTEKEQREDVSEADRKRAVSKYGDVTYADPANKKYPIDTPAHIRAAWNYINMERNAKEYSSSQLSTIKSRIISAWKKNIDKSGPPKASKKSVGEIVIDKVKQVFDIGQEEKEIPEDNTGITVFKNKDGQYVWLAIYSNKFRDRDNPPEIIADKSHRRFVERVEKGLAPYPDLYLWHEKSWNIGKASWVAYDDAGFAMAAGLFAPGCKTIAEWLSKQRNLTMSHGMPVSTIRRDYIDPTIIVEHESREISILPADFEANTLTGFVALIPDAMKSNEEEDMTIPMDKKRELFETLGLPTKALNAVEEFNLDTAKEAAEAGVESKEKGDPEPEVAEVTEEQTEVTEEPEGEAETPAPEGEDSPPSRKELAEALVPFINQVEENDTKTKELVAVVETLTKTVEAQNERIEELTKQLLGRSTPSSLAALLSGSAIGSGGSEVKDGDPLLKSKPKETQPEKEARTGIPVLDDMLAVGQTN